MKNREKVNWQYRPIALALGKLKQGLTKIEITNNDGMMTVISEQNEMFEHLLAHNSTHFQQANESPFRVKGLGCDYINPDNPDNQVEEILNGEVDIEWEGIFKETKLWMAEMQKEMEAKIDLSVSEQDFIKNFKSMPEKNHHHPLGGMLVIV